ncbi:MAG: NosD domain-containing protein, partial [Candidatus Hadarchaeales archaeon]
GIYLTSSDNNTLSNNLVENSAYGIYLHNNSDNSLLCGNTVENTSHGIVISSSKNCTLSGNLVENNSRGISLSLYTDNNFLLGNTAENNTYGIYLYSYCDNNLISGNILKNNSWGIHLEPNSTTNLISNNTLENNSYGIRLYSSTNNNLISGNTVENSKDYGIYLYNNSEKNTLSNNTLNRNYYGIYLCPSSKANIVSNNTIDNSTNSGIYLDDSDNNTLSNNLVRRSSYGIYLKNSSDNNTLSNNTLENNSYGIYLHSYNTANLISGNTLENNSYYGIYLYLSTTNLISGNTLENNSYGVCLQSSHNNTLSGNLVKRKFPASDKTGIYLYFSDNNLISGNTVENNSRGIGIETYSDNNTLSGNLVKNSSGSGIHLIGGENNTLSNNTVENTGEESYQAGILLWNTKNNTLSNNTVENSFYGIRLFSDADNNTLSNNTVENSTYGIYLEGSDNNTLLNNTSKNNSTCSFYLKNSYNNTLMANVYDSSYGIPRVENVSHFGITENSAWVAWSTAENSTSTVEYGITPEYGSTVCVAEMVKNHSVPLQGLSPATTYHYRVASKNGDNNTEISGDFTFTTHVGWMASEGWLGGGWTASAYEISESWCLEACAPSVWFVTEGWILFPAGRAEWFELGEWTGGASSPTPPSPPPAMPTPAATFISIYPSAFTLVSGDFLTLTAVLVDQDNLPLADKVVEWSATFGTLTPSPSKTDASGRASAVFKAPEAESRLDVTVFIRFPGDDQHQPSEAQAGGQVLPKALGGALERLENLRVQLDLVEPVPTEALVRAIEENRLVLVVTIRESQPPSVPEYGSPAIGSRVVVGAAEIKVEIASPTPEGKSVLINLDNRTLEGLGSKEMRIFVDQVEALPAEDYVDVLDPTNDGDRCEYLILLGTKGAQVLVSIPHFSLRVISVRASVVPSVPRSRHLPLAIGLVIFVVLALLLIFCKRPSRLKARAHRKRRLTGRGRRALPR